MVRDFFTKSKTLLFRRQTNILSAAFIIMVAYAASGMLGLVRNRLLAAAFFSGAEAQLDAYFAAFVIPDTLFQLLITGALAAAFIPVYTKYLKENEEEANHVASATINLILTLFVGFIVICVFLSRNLAALLAPSLDQVNQLLLTQLLQIFLVAQIFFALSGFMTAIIQSHRRFLVPAVAPIIYNLSIIAGIYFLSPTMGIFGPAVGVFIGSILHFLVQLPLAIRLGYRYSLAFRFKNAGLKEVARLMPARSLTLAIGQVERFVAVAIATSLAAGSLTILNFARQLFLLPITLFGTTIGQASFPTFSDEIASDKRDMFTQTLKSSILQVLFFALPATVILVVLRLPIVRITFGARNFPWDATLLTSRTVAYLALSIPLMSIAAVLNRAFYATKDTKTPLKISIIGAIMTVGLSVVFSQWMGAGVVGLAFALSCSNIVQTGLLLVSLQKRIAFITSDFLFSLGKMTLASIVTGVFLWIPMRIIDQYILDTTRTINLIILTITALGVGMLVYLNISSIFSIDQLSEVIALGKRIGNWKNILSKSEEAIDTTSFEKQGS